MPAHCARSIATRPTWVRRTRVRTGVALITLGCATPLAAQQPPALRIIGSVADDDARLEELRTGAPRGTLLRDGSHLDGEPTNSRQWFALLQPSLRTVYNRGLATAANDGGLWTGRGLNTLLRAGVAARLGRWRLVLAPELTYSANGPLDINADAPAGFNRWSSPWRTPQAPADLPLRFGSAPIRTVSFGQSALSVAWDRLAIGITSGNLWWGPGLRNALLLSNNAPGIPHLFLRTARPLTTPLGTVEARFIAGALTESAFFDTLPGNDYRAASGLIATLSPSAISGLTVGISRLTVAPVQRLADVTSHAADALRAWTASSPADQMTALFARWIFPDDAAELWAEVAKSRTPATLREWLTAPQADLGWTVGAQWMTATAPRQWRVQMEVSEVAQSQVLANRAPQDWGTGTRAIQGFTQRGRMLGISTGPGSSHWWLALDRMRSTSNTPWRIGGFVTRTRWENDAFYRQSHPNPFGHDVSLASGIRSAIRTTHWDWQATVSLERRYNYQFNSSYLVPLQRGQQNVNNLRLEWEITPRAGAATGRAPVTAPANPARD